MTRRNYLNFTTPVGVGFSTVAQSGYSAFLIHETGHLKPVTNWNHPGVDSPFWRFYHNPQPGSFIRHEDRDIALHAERVVLIPADTLFDCCGPVDTEHFWIHFTVSRHDHWQGHSALHGPQVLPMDDTLRALISDALKAHQAKDHPLRVQRLYHLSAALLHTSFSRLDVPLASTLPPALTELLDLIEKAPHSDLSNPYLARRAGLGVEKFIRWFREHLAQTPAAYVVSARLRLAKQLLALSDKSVDQIAEETGFPNRHYFSRVFAKQVGCGPAEFRLRQGRKKGR